MKSKAGCLLPPRSGGRSGGGASSRNHTDPHPSPPPLRGGGRHPGERVRGGGRHPWALVLPLLLTVVLAPQARAQSALDDKSGKPTPSGPKADSPDKAVLLLKAAWESGDDAGIVARYTDPGASTLKRDLASHRRLEAATIALARAAKDKLDGATPSELGLEERKLVSPYAGATVSISETKIDGEKATARVRIETLDGDREQRTSFVLRAGEWKIVLASADGTPLDDTGLTRLLARAELREKTAAEVELVAKELAAGTLPSRESVRHRIGAALEKERAGLAKLAEDAARAKRGGKSPASDDEGGDDE